MATSLNAESSFLDKKEVFNCLTTFQLTQLSQLKQWSLLHANQLVVPQATPVPGFERLILPPKNVDQDIPAATKQVPATVQEKSFFDDLGDVNDIFDGPSESSEFNFNPEKDIDQVPDRTDFDVFLDEVLGIQDFYGPYKTPLTAKGELATQVCYDFVQDQPNSLLCGYPSGFFDSHSNISINLQANGLFHSSSLQSPITAPLPNEPSEALQSQANSPPNNLFCSQPNNLFQNQTNSPPHIELYGPLDNPLNSPSHVPVQSLFQSQCNSPCPSQTDSSLHSQPNSPMDNHLNSPSNSPPQSPRSPSASETSLNMYSTDEGIGSQSDISECGEDVLELSLSPSVSSPTHEATKQQLLPFVKQDPELVSAKPGRRKRGPRPQVKYTGDGPMQLWQFLLELLIAPEYSKLVKWTLDEDYEFKILKPSQVAKMWGDKKNKPTMNYEKLSRGLRYYYGKSVIEKVHGKRYVYQFKCDIPKILGYDPMVTVKGEESVEDSVCGEPIMSPEMEDLLVTSSPEDGLLAFL